MQPTPGDVHVNTPLTNLSIAYLQNANNFIASKVFPTVSVAKQSDRYFTYARSDFNRLEMRERAPGTESHGSGYNIDSTPTYYCAVYAFHKDVDDQTRANADAALNPDREAMIFVSQQALLLRETKWAGRYFTPGCGWEREVAGAAATPGTDEVIHWSDAASNPIEDIRREKTTMLEQTGFEPNTLTLGRRVYDVLLDHPDIIDRIKYGQTAGTMSPAMASRDKLAQLFEVDKILVSNAIQNTGKEGTAEANSFICGKHALLSYSAGSPGLMTVSAGYTFGWTGYLGNGPEGNRIKHFRMENLASDRVEIEVCFDQKMVCADLGMMFTNIVA